MNPSLVLYNLILLSLAPLLIPVIWVRNLLKRRSVPSPLVLKNNYADGKFLWFLAPSAGEVIIVKTLITALEKELFAVKWLVITSTNSGYLTAKKTLGDQVTLVYLPFDFIFNIKSLLRSFAPLSLIIIESEIRPNLIYYFAKLQVPIIMINANLTGRLLQRYQKIQFFLRDAFAKIDLLCTTNNVTRLSLIKLGAMAERIVTTGNLKFDQKISEIDAAARAALLNQIGVPKECQVIVAGSTHRGEEELILEAYQLACQNRSDTYLVIAPRHLERLPELETYLKTKDIHYQLRSQIVPTKSNRVIILDTFGELPSFYSIASVAVIGGSFVKVGGHNLLEPAAQGCPVIFGPYTENFQEIAALLIENNVGYRVENSPALAGLFSRFINNESLQKEMATRAKELVARNRGALEKVSNLIIKKLKTQSASERQVKNSQGNMVLFVYFLSHQGELFNFIREHLPEKIASSLFKVKTIFNFNIDYLLKILFQQSGQPFSNAKAEKIVNFTYKKFLADYPWLDSLAGLVLLCLKFKAGLYYRLFLAKFQKEHLGVLVIWGGLALPVAAAAEAARDYGATVLFCENGYLPRTIVMDQQGVNAVNSLAGRTRDFYDQIKPEEAKLREMFEERLLQRPLKKKLSKREEILIATESQLKLPESFIFLPLQVFDDSQVLLYSPWFRSMPTLITYCAAEIRKYNRLHNTEIALVVKEHPSDYGRINYENFKSQNQDIIFVRTIETQKLLNACRTVITLNSTVGIEGLFCMKPVITLGEAFYNVSGLVHHLEATEELADKLEIALTVPVDKGLNERFLYNLRFNYLISLNKRALAEADYRPVVQRIIEVLASKSRQPTSF